VPLKSAEAAEEYWIKNKPHRADAISLLGPALSQCVDKFDQIMNKESALVVDFDLLQGLQFPTDLFPFRKQTAPTTRLTVSYEAANNLDPCAVEDPTRSRSGGILFSVLLITVLLLLRLSVRADPLETGAWLKNSADKVALALNLVPFAGIAFLWFIGVLRDRLESLKTASLPLSFSAAGYYSSPCCSHQAPWPAESSLFTLPGLKGCWNRRRSATARSSHLSSYGTMS
jgi:hypothetical protein